MKITVFELFDCENLKYVKGLAELTMLSLNSVITLKDVQIVKSDNAELVNNDNKIISVTMNLTSGSITFEVNIDTMYILIILISNAEDTNKFVEYFCNMFEPKMFKIQLVTTQDKKDCKQFVPEVVPDEPEHKKNKKSTSKKQTDSE
jgi:hypothetical protein